MYAHTHSSLALCVARGMSKKEAAKQIGAGGRRALFTAAFCTRMKMTPQRGEHTNTKFQPNNLFIHPDSIIWHVYMFARARGGIKGKPAECTCVSCVHSVKLIG